MKWIDVRDVAVHVCLSRLPGIIELTTPTPRPVAILNELAMVEQLNPDMPEPDIDRGKKSANAPPDTAKRSQIKSLPSKPMDTRMSKTGDSDRKSSASPKGSKGGSKSPEKAGPADVDADIETLGMNQKTGKLRKHVFAAGYPYSIEVKVYDLENPRPVMVHRGLQVDQDVDRYDILLAVTDVPFDPKTGAPKMEGLKKIQEDEFPFVIVDQPTKCYCNNNENEVYKSPYLEVKDEEFIRVNQALGRWNTKRLKVKEKTKFANRRAKSLPGMTDRHSRSHARRGKRSGGMSLRPTTSFSQGPAIERDPRQASRSMEMLPSRSYSMSFGPDVSGEFSASVTASTRSSEARQGIDKYRPCNSHPCTPRGHHRSPGHGGHGNGALMGHANGGSTSLSADYAEGSYNSYGRSYSRGPPAPPPPAPTPNCPGPKSPWEETRSRVNFEAAIAMKKRRKGGPPGKGAGDPTKFKRSDIKVVPDAYKPPPRVIPKGLKKALQENKKKKTKTKRTVPGPPVPDGKKRGYTDIRVNPCDVIKKSSLSGEKLMYKYFRKDGETTPAWAKSAKKKGIDKKKENKSRRKSEENSKMSKTSKGGGDDEGDDKEGDAGSVSEGGDSQVTGSGASMASEGGEGDWEGGSEAGGGRSSADEALLQASEVAREQSKNSRGSSARGSRASGSKGGSRSGSRQSGSRGQSLSPGGSKGGGSRSGSRGGSQGSRGGSQGGSRGGSRASGSKAGSLSPDGSKGGSRASGSKTGSLSPGGSREGSASKSGSLSPTGSAGGSKASGSKGGSLAAGGSKGGSLSPGGSKAEGSKGGSLSQGGSKASGSKGGSLSPGGSKASGSKSGSLGGGGSKASGSKGSLGAGGSKMSGSKSGSLGGGGSKMSGSKGGSLGGGGSKASGSKGSLGAGGSKMSGSKGGSLGGSKMSGSKSGSLGGGGSKAGGSKKGSLAGKSSTSSSSKEEGIKSWLSEDPRASGSAGGGGKSKLSAKKSTKSKA